MCWATTEIEISVLPLCMGRRLGMSRHKEKQWFSAVVSFYKTLAVAYNPKQFCSGKNIFECGCATLYLERRCVPYLIITFMTHG